MSAGCKGCGVKTCLCETDYERLTEHGVELENELIPAAEEHADSQHYQPGGPIDILFDEDSELETGDVHLTAVV